MTGAQFVIGLEYAPHLSAALERHLRRCREGGVQPPPDIIELARWAQAVAAGLSSPPPLPEADDGPVALLLSLPAAAVELGCSLSTVKKLAGDGTLPTVDFNGVRRVVRGDLEAYVESLRPGQMRDHVEHKGLAARVGS